MQHALLRGLLLTLGATAAAVVAGACSSNATTGGTAGGVACPDTLTAVPNSEFCAADAPKVNCDLVGTETTQLCSVPLKPPTADLKRSSGVKEYAGTGAPQVGCFAPSGYPAKPGASAMVQMHGIAKIFSHGCESKLLKIEVFAEKPGAEGELGDPVGNALTTASDCKAKGLASMNDDCGTRYECDFIYNGIPTETPLVVKTSGDLWAPLYDFNVYIPTGEVKNGVWEHDVRALASDDYNVIAQAAIGGPIASGHGALAGEVHDCGDVRLINAIVNVDKAKRVLTYFTSDEAHPLPDTQNAFATTALGLYAALDIAPGPVTVGAMGLVSGKPVAIGYQKAQIFADSVSVVTFRGLRPYQVP